jgi:hypothetical protein
MKEEPQFQLMPDKERYDKFMGNMKTIAFCSTAAVLLYSGFVVYDFLKEYASRSF